jgi:prenyl protein peptidase
MTWALFFVGSLYVWKYDSVLTPTERDQPHVIMQRLLSVGTVTTCLVLLGPLDRPSLGIPDSILQNVTGAILGLLLMVILYTGPLVYAYLDPDAEILEKPSLSFPFIRNVVIAPLVEEIAFRSCMLPIMIRAGFSQNAAIYITPIFFGLAHVHHLFLNSNDVVKLKIAGKKLIVKKIYLSTIAQAGYTTIFGFITSYLYIHTGTLAAPLLAHVFCNYMGLPPTDFFDQPKAFGA